MDGAAAQDDEGTTEPRRPRRRAVAVLAVTGSVALSCTGIAWATRLPDPPSTPVSRFIPADGTETRERLDNGAGIGTIVSEHARLRGAQAVVGLPTTWGNAVITAASSLDVAVEDIAVWRVVSRRDQGGVVDGQITSLYLDAPSGLYLVGTFGGSLSSVYDPPVLILPADHAVDATWEGSGDALPSGVLTYALTASVADTTDDGCVAVESTFTLFLDPETEFSRAESVEHWCPGQGSRDVTAVYTVDGNVEDVDVALDDSLGLPDLLGDPTATRANDPVVDPLGDPADSEVVAVPTVLVDDLFGEQELGGTTGAAPVVTADGTLVVTYDSGDDVAGFVANDSGGLTESWRAHPGGSILTTAAVGDLVVVTTSERTTVGYDARGVRRWVARTDDLVLAPATGTPEGLAVTIGLDGAVIALDARSGSEAWRSALVTDADLPAVVVHDGGATGDDARDLVVAADLNGTVAAFDARTGDTVWETSTTPVDVLAAGPEGTVVTVDDEGRVRSWRAGDGTEVWRASVGGFAVDATVVDGRVVVATDSETAAFTDAGERLWRRGAADRVIEIGDRLVVLEGLDLVSIDTSGDEVARWPLVEDALTGEDIDVVADGHDIWGITSSADVVRWGPPR